MIMEVDTDYMHISCDVLKMRMQTTSTKVIQLTALLLLQYWSYCRCCATLQWLSRARTAPAV